MVLSLATGAVSAQDGSKNTTPIAPATHAELTNRPSSTVVFVENQGQFDPQVKFQAKVGGQTVWLTAEGIVFDAIRAENDGAKDRTKSAGRRPPPGASPAKPTSKA